MLYAFPRSPVSFSTSLSPRPLSPFLVRDHPRSGYGDFRDDLRQFISSRLDRIDLYAESEEYRAQQEKASQLYERLCKMLPEEGQSLLLQYSDALGAAHGLEVEMLAERAFFDGVRIGVKGSQES